MDKTAKAADYLTLVAVLLSFIPAIGILIGGLFLFVAFIVAIVAISKDNKGAVRVLISTIIAAPIMAICQMVVLSVLGNA